MGYENYLVLTFTKKFTNLIQAYGCHRKRYERNDGSDSTWQKVWVIYPEVTRKYLWEMVMRPGKPPAN